VENLKRGSRKPKPDVMKLTTQRIRLQEATGMGGAHGGWGHNGKRGGSILKLGGGDNGVGRCVFAGYRGGLVHSLRWIGWAWRGLRKFGGPGENRERLRRDSVLKKNVRGGGAGARLLKLWGSEGPGDGQSKKGLRRETRKIQLSNGSR